MAFTAIYFFRDSGLQARIAFEAERQNLNFAKYVSKLVCDAIEKGFIRNYISLG